MMISPSVFSGASESAQKTSFGSSSPSGTQHLLAGRCPSCLQIPLLPNATVFMFLVSFRNCHSSHRCGLLLICVLICGIFTHMRPHVWILPHLWQYVWPPVWVNHNYGHTCGLLLRCVLSALPIDARCSNDLVAAHYRLAHAVLMT